MESQTNYIDTVKVAGIASKIPSLISVKVSKVIRDNFILSMWVKYLIKVGMKDINLELSAMVLEHFTTMRVGSIVDNGCKIKCKEEGCYIIQVEKLHMKASGEVIV